MARESFLNRREVKMDEQKIRQIEAKIKEDVKNLNGLKSFYSSDSYALTQFNRSFEIKGMFEEFLHGKRFCS